MITITGERIGQGWRRRIGGCANRYSGHTIARAIDWEVPHSEPVWVVRDNRGETLGTFEHIEDAMTFSQSTYELSQEEGGPPPWLTPA